MKALGIALVMLGLVALVIGGVGYKRQSTILQVGGITATATEHRTVPVAPVAGAVLLLGGIALLVVPRLRRA